MVKEVVSRRERTRFSLHDTNGLHAKVRSKYFERTLNALCVMQQRDTVTKHASALAEAGYVEFRTLA